MQAHASLELLDAMARELRQIGNIKLMIDAMAHLQHKQFVASHDSVDRQGE